MASGRDYLGVNVNEYLPYHEHLFDEARTNLKSIIEGLAWSLGVGDLATGCRRYAKSLEYYMNLKLPISVEERVQIARVMYRMILHPTTSDPLMSHWSSLLAKLLRNLKPSDARDAGHALILDWRPLMELAERKEYGKCRARQFIGPSVKSHRGAKLGGLVADARKFFSPNAPVEIMDYLRPWFCPQDRNSIFKAQFLCATFIPISPDHAYKEWVEDVMKMWDWIDGVSTWHSNWIRMLGQLAKLSCRTGMQVDWASYSATLFSRFQALLDVPPVTTRPFVPAVAPPSTDPLSNRKGTSDRFHHMAKMIVYAIGPNNDIFERLKSLMTALNPYFHPSTSGGPSANVLASLLQGLSSHYAKRIGAEKKDGFKGEPLDEATTCEFVQASLPSALLGVFNKSSTLQKACNQTLKNFSSVHPELVMPPVLDSLYPALTSFEYAHRTQAVIDTLSLLVKPLLNREMYPEGGAHLQNILTLSLPGIDPNDSKKTDLVLKLYSSLLSYLPLINSQAITPIPKSEADTEAHQATGVFDEWTHEFMSRVFELLQVQEGNEGGANGKKGQKNGALRYNLSIFFWQLSDALYDKTLNRIEHWIKTTMLTNCLKEVGFVCSSAAAANPPKAIAKFIKFAHERLLNKDSSSSEHLCALRVLGSCVVYGGPELLKYKEELQAIFDAFLRDKEKNENAKVSKSTQKVYRKVLRGLVSTYPTDLRSHAPSLWKSEEFQKHHSALWGQRQEDLEVEWHVPSEEEVDFAVSLVNRYLVSELDDAKNSGLVQEVEGGKASEDLSCPDKSDLQITLKLMRSTLRGVSAVIHEPDEPEQSNNFPKGFAPRNCYRYPAHARTYDSMKQLGTTLLPRICDMLHALKSAVLANREDDVPTLKAIVKVTDLLINSRGYNSEQCNKIKRHILVYRKWNADWVVGKKVLPRHMLVSRLHLQHQLLVCESSFHRSKGLNYDRLVADLVDLSMHPYSQVRKKAQLATEKSFSRHARAMTNALPLIFDQIAGKNGGEDNPRTHGRTTGALMLLHNRIVLSRVVRRWTHFPEFVKAFTDSHKHERLSTQTRVLSLFQVIVYTNFPIDINQAQQLDEDWALCKDVSPTLSDSIRDEARESHEYFAKRNEESMQDLVNTLQERLTDPSVHWRYQLLMGSFILLMIRETYVPPTNVVEWFFTNMSSDNMYVRQLCVRAMNMILSCLKRSTSEVGPLGDDWRSATPTAATWSTFNFTDKKYLGWNGSTPVGKLCTAAPLISKFAPEAQPIKELFERHFADEAFCKKFIVCLRGDHRITSGAGSGGMASQEDALFKIIGAMNDKSESADKASHLDVPRCQLWKGFAQLVGLKLVDYFLPYLKTLIDETEERDAQCVAAEMIAGFARGSKNWAYADVQDMWAKVRPGLFSGLDNATPEGADDWASCIRFFSANLDPRRFPDLLDAFVDRCEKAGQTMFGLSKHLQFLLAILSHCGYRVLDRTDRLLSIAKRHLGEPSAQIRQYVGSIVTFIFVSSWRPEGVGAPPHATNEQQLVDFVAHVKQELIDKEQAEANLTVHDAASPEAIALRHLKETILAVLMRTYGSGLAHTLSKYVLTPILPFVFATLQDSAQDMVSHSRCVLDFVKQTVHTQATGNLLMDMCCSDTVLSSKSWTVRAAGPSFLSVLVFKHRYVFPSELLDRAQSALVNLFDDEKPEVQAAAVTAFCSLISHLDDSIASDYAEKFIAGANAASRKKKRAKTESANNSSEATRDVLGLIALVKSSPYSLPKWMPEALVTLANYLNLASKGPLATMIKNTFAEFKRNHQDEWHIQREMFDPDQLDVINQLLVSPSYYA